MCPSRQDIPGLGKRRKATNRVATFLGELIELQVAFGVRQRKPKTVEEAVTATLELESYLTPSSGPGRVAKPKQQGNGNPSV